MITAARRSDKVVEADRTIRSQASASAERCTVVIGVSLDASRTGDPHRRNGTAEKHIQHGRARHGARERKESPATVIASIEGAVGESLSTVLSLELHEGVVACAYVAQCDRAVFQVSTS